MTSSQSEDFGANQGFIEDLYAAYLEDPSKVGPQWSDLFRRWAAEGRTANPTSDAGD